MATTIVLKNSVTTTNTPSSLAQGEVAINVTDKKVWVGNAATTPIQIVNGGPDGVFTSVTDSGLTNTRVTYAGAGGLLKDSANITTDGTILTATKFSGALNGTVGATTPAAGAFTTITASSTIVGSSTVTGTALIPSGATVPSNGVYLPTTNAVGFSSNSSENARLDTAGFKVGTTADDPVAARVLGTSIRSSAGANGAIYSRGGGWELGIANSSGNHIYFYTDTGSANQSAGQISSSGTSTTYGTGSDYRLKDNIQPMIGALDKVSQLNPVTFKWKMDGLDGQGFIAHELQAVSPDCVLGKKDAIDENGKPIYQNIDTSFLVATLTAAIQELNDKVDAQAAEIAALKAGA
jgi:hypothetical protein